jgi:predicted DNA-binding transcriptional regulator AlpA
MTVSAAIAGTGRPSRRSIMLPRPDRLIPFPQAARRLGKTSETLRRWHDEGHLPAVVSPGGQLSTYESFINAVLASARPGQAGVIEDIARDWFAQRGIASEAVR